MKVRELDFHINLGRDSERSSGIHQSSIIKAIALNVGFLDAIWASDEIGDPHMVALGLAWEDWVGANLHPEISYHPGETRLDSISLTCDGISEITPDEYNSIWLTPLPGDFTHFRINEFKLTKKSSRDIGGSDTLLLGRKWWMWVTQIKGYCMAWGTRWARLHIMFLNGDYTKSGVTAPQYRIFDIEFSEYEIADNWQMILAHKHLGKEE
jgi:hypothetical protein